MKVFFSTGKTPPSTSYPSSAQPSLQACHPHPPPRFFPDLIPSPSFHFHWELTYFSSSDLTWVQMQVPNGPLGSGCFRHMQCQGACDWTHQKTQLTSAYRAGGFLSLAMAAAIQTHPIARKIKSIPFFQESPLKFKNFFPRRNVHMSQWPEMHHWVSAYHWSSQMPRE